MYQKKWKRVITFRSTQDAMRMEELCRAAGIPGRLIPVPVDISADCGLAWMSDLELQDRLDQCMAGQLVPQGLYERMLRG